MILRKCQLSKRQAEQQDFECFFERYLRFLRSQPPDYGLPLEASRAARPDGALTGAQRMAAALPRVFDVTLKRNLEVKAPEVRGIDHLDSLLFKGVLQHYEDFRQWPSCRLVGRVANPESVAFGEAGGSYATLCLDCSGI